MHRPKLIIVGGSLAVGKTTLAKRLCGELGIHRISMDELKEHLFDYAGYQDRAWSRRIGQITWPLFKELVDLHLSYGNDVVAEATFLWHDDAAWINSLKEKHGAELSLLWLTTDPRVARERFTERSKQERHPGHNDALEQVLEEFDEKYFNRTFIPLPIDGETKIIDTTDFGSVDYEDITSFVS